MYLYLTTHDICDEYVFGVKFYETKITTNDPGKISATKDALFKAIKSLDCETDILNVLRGYGISGDVKIYNLQNDCSCCS